MRARYRRLQQLERQMDLLAASRLAETAGDDITAWCRGGCLGPLPPPGPQPVKYTAEQWQAQHRLLLMLCCRALEKVDPPEMTPPQRQEADETLVLFAAIDHSGQLPLPQQARLACYREVIARFLNPARGSSALPGCAREQPA